MTLTILDLKKEEVIKRFAVLIVVTMLTGSIVNSQNRKLRVMDFGLIDSKPIHKKASFVEAFFL